MSAPAPRDHSAAAGAAGAHGAAGAAQATERLVLYRRYADLVAAQEAALDANDLDGFQSLGRELESLRAAIGAAGPPVDGSEDQGGAARARQAADLLRAALVRTRRIQTRLDAMKREQATEIRTLSRRRPHLRTYAVPPEGGGHPHVDVRM